MKDVLRELFGEGVTDEVVSKFNAELGRRYVPKGSFKAKSDELAKLSDEKLVLDERFGKMEVEFSACKLRECGLVSEVRDLRVDNVVMDILRKSGARNFTAVKSLLNLGDFGLDFDVSELTAKVESEIFRLKSSEDTEFLFKSVYLPRAMLRGFSPAESSEIFHDAQGDFNFRLAVARRGDDHLSMVRIKQEAAKKGVFLP